MFCMAVTLPLSGLTPWGVQVCPKNWTSLHLNWTFSLLNTMPFCRARSMRLAKLRSCSFSVGPKTKVSSAIPVTPLRPSSAESSCFWNTSWATVRPKGRRKNRNLPKGVLNVVR